jgi:DNA-binding GntR family transcriptional regulator
MAAGTGSSDGAVAAVVACLGADIAAGRLAPGTRLTEAGLAARFGLSRGPVREALRQLGSEGLVVLARHRGAEVRRLTRAEVAALYELREVTEGLAARLAAARMHEAAPRQAVAEAFGRLAAAALAADGAAFVQANAAFHALLVGLAGNPHLTATAERLSPPALRAQFRLLLDPAAIAESQAGHAAIGAALMAGDGAAAEAAMRAHVRGAATRLQAEPDTRFG